jgi:hypothetical protein
MVRAEEHLHQKLSEVPPGSFRQTVLLAARRFKSSWVDLGKLLVKVRNEALFEDWGYPSFEAYCLAELRIRRQTAEKLVRSFSFLDKHEPERMERPQIVEEAPAFEVVEVLAQAEERGQLSASEYKSIRDAIWNPEKPASELRRELTQRFPAPEAPASDLAALKRLWGLSKRLAAELHAHKKVPKAVAERADALAGDLEALLAKKAEA